jgi:hypothetical protein
MALAGAVTANTRWGPWSAAAGERSNCPKGNGSRALLQARHLRGGSLGRDSGERYQGGVAHRSAEATASWWHLLSDAAVSEARAAARSATRRIMSVTFADAREM